MTTIRFNSGNISISGRRSIAFFSPVLLVAAFALAFAFALMSKSVRAETNSLHWRGPTANGHVGEGVFPTKWSEDSVLWKVDLNGRGGSTPIVVSDQIVLTAGIEGKNNLLAFDLAGKELWKTSLGDERPGKHKKASGSNSSPISDGQNLYAYFKSGDLACCDLNGKVLWQRNIQTDLGEDTLWWDLGTSPVLTDDFVVVAVMQTGPSFLVAFDKKTGEQKWLSKREMDVKSESNQAYTTPVIADTKEGKILLTLGADYVTAHLASNGKYLWKVGSFNPTNHQYFRSIASPVVVGDLVICPYARGGNLSGVLYGSGIADENRLAWQRTDIGSDVPTPVWAGERAYVCGDKGEITCIQASTGKTLWSHSLPKNRNAFSASPVIAGGNLYFLREDGLAFVIRDADQFELVSENQLDTNTVSTPVAIDGKILIRSFDSLYCIANP